MILSKILKIFSNLRLKAKLSSWKAQAVWAKFDKRAGHKVYKGGRVCAGQRVLVIGAGPCGLRTAIEAQFLGARHVIMNYPISQVNFTPT